MKLTDEEWLNKFYPTYRCFTGDWSNAWYIDIGNDRIVFGTETKEEALAEARRKLRKLRGDI